MDGMGTEVLELPWVEAIVLLFTKFGWALYVVGMVVAVYECAIVSFMRLKNGGVVRTDRNIREWCWRGEHD